MEEEWIRWMRDNAPKHLYEQMEGSVRWSAKWRDQEIKRLQSRLETFMDQSYPERRFDKEYVKRLDEALGDENAERTITENASDPGAAARLMDLFNKYHNAAAKTIKAADDLLLKVMLDHNEIEQTAGKALGYPWYKDDQKNFPDATEVDGVCAGEHVAVSIVDELANTYIALCTFLQAFKTNEERVDEMQKKPGGMKEHILTRLDLLKRAYKCAGIEVKERNE